MATKLLIWVSLIAALTLARTAAGMPRVTTAPPLPPTAAPQ